MLDRGGGRSNAGRCWAKGMVDQRSLLLASDHKRVTTLVLRPLLASPGRLIFGSLNFWVVIIHSALQSEFQVLGGWFQLDDPLGGAGGHPLKLFPPIFSCTRQEKQAGLIG